MLLASGMHQVDNIAFFMTFQENFVGVCNKSFRSSRIRVASPADSHVTFRGSVSTEESTKIGKRDFTICVRIGNAPSYTFNDMGSIVTFNIKKV